MFENMTYEFILKRTLDNVKAKNPNLDTREGSIIYNALAPCAVELANAYIQLDTILNESFADTQTRPYLIKRCAERGVNVKLATKAIRKGEFNIDIPIGTRFSLGEHNYIVLDQVSMGIFRLECESPGYGGNVDFGKLTPIDYINGLEKAELTDVLIPGEDDEETEKLRERYFNSLDSKSFGGNITDYKEKTKAINGVGGVKVYPAWDGGGTVKLVLINSDFGVPSSILIEDVQTKIDPKQNQGKGIGMAPIGHVVTVAPCEETEINVKTNITFKDGWDWPSCQMYIDKVIDDYFLELAESWEKEENIIVRISQIESRLLDVEGVLDVKDTTLNDVSENVIIYSDNIPSRGEVGSV